MRPAATTGEPRQLPAPGPGRRQQTHSRPASRDRALAHAVVAIGLVAVLVASTALAVTTRTDDPSSPTAGPSAGTAGDSAAGASDGRAGEAIPGREGQTTGADGGRVGAKVQAARDALAARPMRQLPQSYMRPMPVSTRDPGPPITLPSPTKVGPAGVATGFPHTREGAMAQLAAIDKTAMESATLAGAREIIRRWAMPGGPTPTSWSGTAAMASLLTGAGLSSNGSPSLRVVVTPAMGLIKGHLGDDFVVPCVDFLFEISLDSTVRAGVADCQRMVWSGDRWMIGPGPEAAPGPSVWPGSDTAIEVGYRELRGHQGTTDD